MFNFNMILFNMNINMIFMIYIWLLFCFIDWISDVIISRFNLFYLKVIFDVKSWNVIWYVVELWDSFNNLIKSERMGKVYIGDIS